MPQSVVSSSMVPFATPLPEHLVSLLQETARQEGRPVQAVLEDALLAYMAAHRQNKVRRHVVAAALQASMVEFDSLYDKLSK